MPATSTGITEADAACAEAALLAAELGKPPKPDGLAEGTDGAKRKSPRRQTTGAGQAKSERRIAEAEGRLGRKLAWILARTRTEKLRGWGLTLELRPRPRRGRRP